MPDLFDQSELTAELFLKEYWQKKPCCLKGALTEFENPLSIDELKVLATQELIESRIISGTEQLNDWQVEQGPFDPVEYQALSGSPWTLLVQAVDQWSPETRQLMEYFRFISSWRVDDIMVSYASTGGSVGPHFDYYDVFLIQLNGSRRWKIGQQCTDQDELLDHPDVKILSEFNTDEEWLAEPGDVIYIPPGFAHFGVAQDDQCMTYSVGFRAPSESEIVSEYFSWLADQLPGNQRYSDPDLQLQPNPGEVTLDAAKRIQTIIEKHLKNPESMVRWLASYMTEPKYPELLDEEPERILNIERFEEHKEYIRNESFRFAYFKNLIFINGEEFELPTSVLPLAHTICNDTRYLGSDLIRHAQTLESQDLLEQLFDMNAIYEA